MLTLPERVASYPFDARRWRHFLLAEERAGCRPNAVFEIKKPITVPIEAVYDIDGVS